MEPFGLINLQYYLDVKINLPFIQGAARCWRPDENVFHFYNTELCPLMEEFGAILDLPCTEDTQMAIPITDCGEKHPLFLSSELSKSILSGDPNNPGIRLCTAFQVLQNVSFGSAPWISLMKLLLVCTFLCQVPNSGICGFRLFSVIAQLAPRVSPVMVILAETLICLGSINTRGRIEKLGGSFLLLQLWLAEKLNFLKVPFIYVEDYRPKYFQYRMCTIEDFQPTGWEEWFSRMDEWMVRWMNSFWRYSTITLSTGGDGVLLCGLDRYIRYYPDRVKRQFGEVRDIPTPRFYEASSAEYSDSWPTEYAEHWNKTRKCKALSYKKVIPWDVKKGYKKWFKNVVKKIDDPINRWFETTKYLKLYNSKHYVKGHFPHFAHDCINAKRSIRRKGRIVPF